MPAAPGAAAPKSQGIARSEPRAAQMLESRARVSKIGRRLDEQDAPVRRQVAEPAAVVETGIERGGSVHEVPLQLEKPIFVDVEAEGGCHVVLHVVSAAAVAYVGVVAGVVEPRVQPLLHAV